MAIGFDIVFAEPDRTSPSYVAERTPGLDQETIEKLRKLPSNDAIFARVISRHPVVLGLFSGAVGEAVGDDAVLKKLAIATIGGDPKPFLKSLGVLVQNLPELNEAASGLGALVPEIGHDSIIRRVPAVFKTSDGAIVPTLSLELLRLAVGGKAIAVKRDLGGLTSVVLKGVEVPVDQHGRMWLNGFRMNPERYHAIGDIMAGRVAPKEIANRIVLVGATAAGLKDLRSTSLAANVPAVEVHAHLLENIFNKNHLLRTRGAGLIEHLVTIGVGLLMILTLGVVGARLALLVFLTAAGGLIVGALYFVGFEAMLFDPSYPVAVALVVYVYLVYASYVSEEKQRVFIRGAMGQYLSPELVDQLAEEPDRLKLGGEHRELTFMFSDVRGFTAISEQFHDDPQGLIQLINRLLTPLTQTIQKRRGTIDKYTGDGIMAFWNAPLDDPDHARHACESALGMERELKELNDKLTEEMAGREAKILDIGIGINTGGAIVGNLGSDLRFDYSVAGDVVNLASRLEGTSKTYGVRIIIGEDTQAILPDMATLELDLIVVEGRSAATRIFTLFGDAKVAQSSWFRNLVAAQTRLLTAYRAQDWVGARQWIATCRQMKPELADLYDLYEERIQAYEADPPGDDWDGVFIAETK